MAIPYLDLITAALGFVMTLLIFSYAIGDNPLFRIGVYLFVGVSAGYIGAIAWWQVLWPRLIFPLLQGDFLLGIPLVLAALILMKVSPRLAGLSSVAMALLVGVGAAVTIVGAVSGTIFPQVMGTINAFDLNAASARGIGIAEVIFNGSFILAGVVLSLAYFHFGAKPSKADGSMRRMRLVEMFAWVGRIFIGITLGAIFAGVFSASFTALIERMSSIINFIGSFL